MENMYKEIKQIKRTEDKCEGCDYEESKSL